MIAIVKTGGKQYVVQEGDTLKIEKVATAPGERMNLDVLLLADEASVKIGKPVVSDGRVEAQVLTHGRSKKVTVIKFKSKVRYKRKRGHRQEYSQVKIEKIG